MPSQLSELVRRGQPDGAEVGDLDAGVADAGQRDRLSPLRVVAAVLAVVGLLGAGGWTISRHVAASRAAAALAKSSDRSWFAPYVDTTLPPYLQFQDPSVNPAAHVVLGFVVSDKHDGCAPSWGSAYGLDGAGQALALDRRIAEYRNEGGDPIVSFGGQANSELATSCTSTTALQHAYQSVIDRYKLDTIDLDLEGAALYDTASIERRDQALSAVQHASAQAHKQLKIWLTLPAGVDGLPTAADELLTRMLRDRVELAGVNVMAMDYGTPQPDMLAAAERSTTAAAHQLATAYRQAGEPLPGQTVWRHVGVTVMVGVNDSPNETFTTSDAAALTRFASQHRMGRTSLWSLNRDAACTAATFSGAVVHSNTCSGVRQAADGSFSAAMAKFSPDPPSAKSPADLSPPAASASAVGKDPSNSPYPAWKSWPTYVQNYRVERDGNIYEAKWQNSGSDPVADTGSNPAPWQLLGPVLPTDHAPRITKLVSGHYPRWSPTRHYQTGAIVEYDKLPYTARWFTVGTSPAAASLGANAAPWLPLFDVEGEPSAADGSALEIQGLS